MFDLELVVVSSDKEETEKIAWLREQSDVRLVSVADRDEFNKRQQSLYFYENLGLEAATGQFIFIANDDGYFSSNAGTELVAAIKLGGDIFVAPSYIDSSSHGLVTPEIGKIEFSKHDSSTLFLLDFAFFKREVFDVIGLADERFDWYGRGADMSIRASLARLSVRTLGEDGAFIHQLEEENRNPPHPTQDFRYLKQKWGGLMAAGAPRISMPSIEIVPILPLFAARYLWPVFVGIKNKLRN